MPSANHRDDVGVCLTSDLDAFEEVIRGLPAHRRIRVADAAELVLGFLEEVRVDGPDAQTQRLGATFQLAVVVHPVPRDVDRHRRAYACKSVHLRRVGQLLERVAGHPRLREDSEARARVAVAPRGGLHPLGAQPFLHRFYLDPAGSEGLCENFVSSLGCGLQGSLLYRGLGRSVQRERPSQELLEVVVVDILLREHQRRSEKDFVGGDHLDLTEAARLESA